VLREHIGNLRDRVWFEAQLSELRLERLTVGRRIERELSAAHCFREPRERVRLPRARDQRCGERKVRRLRGRQLVARADLRNERPDGLGAADRDRGEFGSVENERPNDKSSGRN
jgi:hypothetical protein